MDEVSLAGRDLAGQVVFGFPSSVSMVLSVPLAETVRLEAPRIRLRAVEAMSGFIRDWLMEGAVDLAILYDTAGLVGCEITPLMTEGLKFYCAADAWPFDSAPGTPVPLAHAAAQELVLPSANHGLRMLIDRSCRSIDAAPNVVVEMDSLTQILSLVARGSAATILAPAAAEAHLAANGMIGADILDPAIRRQVHLVRKADRTLTRATREVEAMTLNIMRELVRRNLWPGELIAEGQIHPA